MNCTQCVQMATFCAKTVQPATVVVTVARRGIRATLCADHAAMTVRGWNTYELRGRTFTHKVPWAVVEPITGV